MCVIKDSVNYRRHRTACKFYRERWFFDWEQPAISTRTNLTELTVLPGVCADESAAQTSDDDDCDNVEVLYQSFCLKDYPAPATLDEEEKCFHSRRECWREREAREAAERLRRAAQFGDSANIGYD